MASESNNMIDETIYFGKKDYHKFHYLRFRLRREFKSLGFDSYFEPNGLCAISVFGEEEYSCIGGIVNLEISIDQEKEEGSVRISTSSNEGYDKVIKIIQEETGLENLLQDFVAS